MFLILINLNIISTLVLTIMLFLIGTIIKNNVNFFNKFCIPAPVIGGLLFCILNLFLRLFNICTVTMNTSLMTYFICFFFTIVGLGISISIVKKGGKQLILYWILCGVLSFCQNILAIVLSKVTNIHPLIGLMCGTISMEGGHGYAAAFGSTIENIGISNASSVGIAAATFGLMFAGLLGGPVSKFLIEKYNLNSYKSIPKPFKSTYTKSLSITSNPYLKIDAFSFLEQVLIVLLCVSCGEFIANIISKSTNIIIPTITGCMLVSVIFRNLNDKINFFELDFNLLHLLSEISLGIFLTMALMSIDLLKLSSLFGPIIIIVISQAIFIVLFAIFVVFRALGKNLDAAIMVSGLIGHGLGATPIALANMNSVSEIYGSSEKAFLIVPLVAAFLLDVFTMPCIIFFINILS
ncbi:sodium/glutamate symporter [Romboutsia sp.]|uniref:sodium/glutamate symporter n=1 Tax=Romboutsia sp. TaxID=1965302 RepID=UPI002BFC59A4|nr:sodium/glutamate symporter [Romboutsia sp.]HSQ89439.1 sodium/glutamate symporter [Romboutsia sp.]